MAESTMYVPQGDDHAVHWTVVAKSSGIPQDLTDWTVEYRVSASKTSVTADFTYDSEALSPRIELDDQAVTRGGISMRFDGTDIPTATAENAPKWYRLRIFHATLAPNGRTVAYGNLVIQDV